MNKDIEKNEIFEKIDRFEASIDRMAELEEGDRLKLLSEIEADCRKIQAMYGSSFGVLNTFRALIDMFRFLAQQPADSELKKQIRLRLSDLPVKINFEDFTRIALALPGVELGIAYNRPIFRVKNKMMARLTDDVNIAVIKIELPLRSTLIADDGAFFMTPHYEAHPLMLVDLSKVETADLKYLLEQSWRMVATKKMIADFDKV